jgi:hypothetical protein
MTGLSQVAALEEDTHVIWLWRAAAARHAWSLAQCG